MPLESPATQHMQHLGNVRPWLRWYASLAGLLNLALLIEVVHRFQRAATPINHGLARILATALLVNLAGAAAVLWLALVRQWRTWLSPVLLIDLLISAMPLLLATLRDGDKALVFRLFGLMYVMFLLSRMIELLAYMARNATDQYSPLRLRMMVFAAAFIVYGGVVPWMALASAPQGDEAHFMLLTHSLVFDHDFDVGDNYRNGDYKEQFPPPSRGSMRGYPYASMERDNMEYLPREPHVVKNYRGQLMLEHDMGFPLLLVPGYAADLREGALFTQALIGAVGAAAIYEAALLLGADSLHALLTVGLFCFTTPYWVFTQSALADLGGAVGSLWIGLQFLRYRRRDRERYLLLAGVLIAILPWLNIRFWALAGSAFLVLSVWVIRHDWNNWPSLITKMGLLGIPSVVSVGASAVIDKALFNTYLPNASMIIFKRVTSRAMPAFGFNPVHGFLGMMFDQSYGLIPTAPLYVAVAAGMAVLFRRDRWAFAALSLPAVGYLPFVSCTRYWSGGWAAPGRYLLSAFTLAIPAVALVLKRKVHWAVIVLGAWSFFNSILFTVNPYLRMPSLWVLYPRSMLVEFFHDHIHTPMYSILSIFPNFMLAQPGDYLRGWLWLAVFVAAAAMWSRTAEEVPQPSEETAKHSSNG